MVTRRDKIEETDRQVMEMSEYIRGQEETEIVSTYIGRTPPRYYLSNVSFGPRPIMHKYW